MGSVQKEMDFTRLTLSKGGSKRFNAKEFLILSRIQNYSLLEKIDEVVHALTADPTFRLSETGAALFLEQFEQELFRLEPQKSMEAPSLLLNALIFLLPDSSIATELGRKGPAHVREHYKIHLYLLSSNTNFTLAARSLCRVLRESVPGFGAWREFVVSTPETDNRLALILKNFASFQLAKGGELTDQEYLQRQLFRQADNMVKHAKNGARPANDLKLKIAGTPPSEVPETPTTEVPPETPAQAHTSTASALDQALRSTFSLLEGHSSERQAEILDDAQTLSLAALFGLRHQEFPTQEARQAAILEAVNNLVQVLDRQQKNKRRRMEERLEAVQKTLREEDRAAFEAQRGLQASSIAVLERVYQTLVGSASVLGNLAEELASFSRYLCDVYEVMISVVISGLGSVGKSTVVNCLVGRNLSPSRDDSMTSIPIRYLHNPTLTEPQMLVPFHAQVNQVLRRLRSMAAAPEDRQRLFSMLTSRAQQVMFDMILDKPSFRLEPRYQGEQSIVETTTHIHDIVRLAANSIFEDQLLPLLPLDWSRGLDSYLTVQACFPDLSATLGLVEFSIVDTPGIDEANATKLALKKVVEDALGLCNLAALVTTPRGYNAEAMVGLVEMFQAAQLRAQLPTLALVTHREEVTTKKVPETKSNISLTLCPSPTSPDPVFPPESIFVVSAKKKFFSQCMRRFIAEHGRKPREEDEPVPGGAALASDWITFFSDGFDEEEKREKYLEIGVDALRERCTTIETQSFMGEPQAHLLQLLSTRSISLSSRTALLRAKERADLLVSQLESRVTAQQAAAAREQGDRLRKELEDEFVKLIEALQKKGRDLRAKLPGQLDAVERALNNWGGKAFPFRKEDIKELKANRERGDLSFIWIASSYFSIQSDSNVVHLVTQDDTLVSNTQGELEKALAILNDCLRAALEDHLCTINQDLDAELNRVASPFISRIQTLTEELCLHYNARLSVNLPKVSRVDLRGGASSAPIQPLSIGYQIKIASNKSMLGRFRNLFAPGRGGQNTFVLTPKEVRMGFLEVIKQLRIVYIGMFEKRVMEQVSEIVNRVVKEKSEVVDQVQKVVDDVFVLQNPGVDQARKQEVATALKAIINQQIEPLVEDLKQAV